MSELFEFEAQVRTDLGKSAARRLRRLEDKVPAIVYGAGKEPVALSILHKSVIKALEQEAVYSHILTLKFDGKSEKVVLKDLLRHPSKPKILHMDFLRVNTKEKLTMHVPLHFEGDEKSPGLKDGGVLSKVMTELEITCLPSNLPEYIAVDISGMEMGDAIHITEVVLPKGVELAHAVEDDEHDHPVVSIHAPKAEAEPEEGEEEAAESDDAAENEDAKEADSSEADADK